MSFNPAHLQTYFENAVQDFAAEAAPAPDGPQQDFGVA